MARAKALDWKLVYDYNSFCGLLSCLQALSAGCGGALEDIVSLTPIGAPRHKITVASLREKKFLHEPITCLTAYDYSSARLVDEAGIDIVLVATRWL